LRFLKELFNRLILVFFKMPASLVKEVNTKDELLLCKSTMAFPKYDLYQISMLKQINVVVSAIILLFNCSCSLPQLPVSYNWLLQKQPFAKISNGDRAHWLHSS